MLEEAKAAVKWLLAEGQVIAQAPVSFVTSVVLVGIVLFFAIKAFFKEHLEVLEQRLKHAQDVSNAYKDRLQGATPDEAARTLHALQARVMALEPRKLSSEQRDTIRNILRRRSGSIEISNDGAVADAAAYGGALVNLFQECGWQVAAPMVLGPSRRPPSGIAVEANEPHNDEAKLVIEALKASRVDFDVYPSPLAGRPLSILITSRQ